MKECDKRSRHKNSKLHMTYISSNNDRHPITKTFNTLTPLHYIYRHFTSSHLNFTQLHFTTLSFGLNPFKYPTAPIHLSSLHFTSLHFTALFIQTYGGVNLPWFGEAHWFPTGPTDGLWTAISWKRFPPRAI